LESPAWSAGDVKRPGFNSGGCRASGINIRRRTHDKTGQNQTDTIMLHTVSDLINALTGSEQSQQAALNFTIFLLSPWTLIIDTPCLIIISITVGKSKAGIPAPALKTGLRSELPHGTHRTFETQERQSIFESHCQMRWFAILNYCEFSLMRRTEGIYTEEYVHEQFSLNWPGIGEALSFFYSHPILFRLDCFFLIFSGAKIACR
jgi:hypothetical protein